MIKFFRPIISFCLLTAICLAFFIPAALSATSLSETGLNATAGAAYGNNIPFKDKDAPAIIGQIVGSILSFVGVLFFLLMIYGGLLWMTARGNDQQVEKAKNLIIAAIVGLVIILSAYAITSLIGGALKP